jgi:hypothetical protein
MRLTVDQHPVSALGPDGPHPAFGITIRPGRQRRRLHDSHADAGEDLIEHGSELGVTVPDEEPWTASKIRDPAAADRWTWLIIAAHTQLRLARPLAADLRRPWERPAPPGRLTPARVRRRLRNIRAKTAQPASTPKPGKPGPGRPPGSKNRHMAPRHDVGKTTKRELTLKARRERAG